MTAISSSDSARYVTFILKLPRRVQHALLRAQVDSCAKLREEAEFGFHFVKDVGKKSEESIRRAAIEAGIALPRKNAEKLLMRLIWGPYE